MYTLNVIPHYFAFSQPFLLGKGLVKGLPLNSLPSTEVSNSLPSTEVSNSLPSTEASNSLPSTEAWSRRPLKPASNGAAGPPSRTEPNSNPVRSRVERSFSGSWRRDGVCCG